MILAFSAACTPKPQARPAGGGTTPAKAPPTGPANVSPREAPIGTARDSPPVDPLPPPRSSGRGSPVRFEIRHSTIPSAPGVQYAAWTCQGTVPGPIIRVTQGDTVDFTLINRAPMPHSMDFHAAQIAPNKYYVNVLPNDSIHYRFAAEVPGAFMYHCGTAPV